MAFRRVAAEVVTNDGLGFTFEVAEEVRHGNNLDRFDLPDRKQVVVTADEPMDSCRYRTGKKLYVVWVSQYRGPRGVSYERAPPSWGTSGDFLSDRYASCKTESAAT